MRRLWATLGAAVLLVGCDRALDIDPTTAVDFDKAIVDARSARAALHGVYDALQSGSLYSRDHVVYPELYADNLTFTGTFQTDREVALRSIQPSNGAILGMWTASYNGINRANLLLEALPTVPGLTDAERAQMRGEALFVRALHYFNLVRYWGGVPLVLQGTRGVADAERAKLPRARDTEVYARIEADLQEAVNLLPDARLPGRATRGAAQALLAKVYLEQGKWSQARDAAAAVIASGRYQIVPNYRDLFATKNSAESIFELQYSPNDTNNHAFWLFPVALGGRRGYAPSTSLFNAYEAGDQRRDATIARDAQGRLYGIKYFRIATNDDNVIVLRLAEMYLIRAEANARLGQFAQARDDINEIRKRAGLGRIDCADLTGCLQAVIQERRVEFAIEGHRFFDLRRAGLAEQVLGIPAFRLLWPIPLYEIERNPNLTQNPGY